MTDQKIEIEIVHGETLQLQDGDVVVITVARSITSDQAYEIEREVSEKLPRGTTILILGEATKLSVLRGIPTMETI